MFIGHFAVGFAGKRLAPRASLAALFAAALFADILWPVLVAIGIERVRIVPGSTVVTPLEFVSYPWSHSLLMLGIWGALIAIAYRSRPDGARTGLVLGGLVLSHWALDFITHRPDMPAWPGGPEMGLGLWNSVGGTMAVEIALFAAGLFIYVRATRARDHIGRWSLWSMSILLFAAFIFDSLDPSAPSSVQMLWISALVATALTLIWAWSVDRHREVRSEARPFSTT